MQHDKIAPIELFNFKKCPVVMIRKFLLAFSSYFCTIMMKCPMRTAYVGPIQAVSIFSSVGALTLLTYPFLTCI